MRELAAGLSRWLRYQRRLGFKGVPGEVMAKKQDEPRQGETIPTLEEIREEMGKCQRCNLYRGATNLVFGEGNPNAALMFIGEAPGAEEDQQGLPFVGAAGQVLNNLLNKLGLSRDEVYITNVVKSRPPGNRDPLPEEIEACLPFLEKQIRAIRPRVIVTLGKIATHALLKTREPITQLRGKWRKYGDIRVMPTFHPSYLNRFPKERHKTWADMLQVMEYLASHEEN